MPVSYKQDECLLAVPADERRSAVADAYGKRNVLSASIPTADPRERPTWE
jgi:hypothetical protein